MPPSPAPPSALPRDRLSTLPPELLTKIFKIVREDTTDSPSLAVAISRQLLPFALPNLYLKIRIKSYKALGLLCRTIAENPARGSLVESMDIELEGKGQDLEDELDLVRLGDSFLVRDVELGGEELAEDEVDWVQTEAAVISLHRLWRLWISGSCTVARCFLSSEVCRNGLDNLPILRIVNFFPSTTTFAPELYAHLLQLPELRWLALEFDTVQPYARRSRDARFVPIWDLGMLDVTGPFIDPALADLITQCPSLHDLRLVDTVGQQGLLNPEHPRPQLYPLPRSRPFPPQPPPRSIRRSSPRSDNNTLASTRPSAGSTSSKTSTSAQTLRATRCSSTTSATLSHSNLSDSGTNSRVCEKQVRSLLGPRKLSKLQKLSMDNMWGQEEGMTFEDIGGSPPFMGQRCR